MEEEGIGKTLNREGNGENNMNNKPEVKEGCLGCGRCINVCPASAISMESNKAHIDADLCVGCRRCVQVCPAGVIE